jgi:hypothetical protein
MSTHPHGSLTILGVLYWGMPLDNTYCWLWAITPTTALNHHDNKQQTQAYQVSWHRMFLPILIRASSFSALLFHCHFLDDILLMCRNFQQS